MLVNQQGKPVFESLVDAWTLEQDPNLLAQTVIALLDHLELRAVSTNATRHSNPEIELRSVK